MGYWYTYNAITYTLSGTCSGFGGDGSGIPIDFYRVNSNTQDEMILSTTTTTSIPFLLPILLSEFSRNPASLLNQKLFQKKI